MNLANVLQNLIKFTSDDTITEYAKEIWELEKIDDSLWITKKKKLLEMAVVFYFLERGCIIDSHKSIEKNWQEKFICRSILTPMKLAISLSRCYNNL